MEELNIVTAVSRPYNLPKILKSMERALEGNEIPVRWILVFDSPGLVPVSVVEALDKAVKVKVHPVLYPGGRFKFGVKQKNFGIDQIEGGWFHLLDDDNIVHPNFFRGIIAAVKRHPDKKAFCFSQHRWDTEDKIASPDRMKPAMIDNTMFVIHMDLIRRKRYVAARAGIEDYWFFRELYDAHYDQFVFLNEYLAFYNYLAKFPDAFGDTMGGDKVIVTMGDEQFRPLTDLTFPMMRNYAERIGAAFHILEGRDYPDVNICYEKFRMRELLDRYRRIAYIDGDVLVRNKADDIFKTVPVGQFSAMNEHDHITFWDEQKIAQQFEPYGWKGPWNKRHFNAGVLVFGQDHKRLFENPSITNIPYWDQPYLNVAVDRLQIPYFPLPPEYNFMIFHPYRNPGNLHERAHFIHFSGTTMTPAEKAVRLREEMAKR